jgi:hypothetical protein
MRRVGVEDRDDAKADPVVSDGQQEQEAHRRVLLAEYHAGDQPRQRDVGGRRDAPALRDRRVATQCHPGEVHADGPQHTADRAEQRIDGLAQGIQRTAG